MKQFWMTKRDSGIESHRKYHEKLSEILIWYACERGLSGIPRGPANRGLAIKSCHKRTYQHPAANIQTRLPR